MFGLKKKSNKDSKKDSVKKKEKQKKNSQPKENKNGKVAEKEKVALDVWYYRASPIATLVAGIMIFVGFVLIGIANHNYDVRMGQMSMKPGTELPLFSGEEKGKLTMGNMLVSRDKKEVAVEVKYDDTAHEQLSAFGKNYKIYVLTQSNYPTEGLKVKYGFFGTDGSGVVEISSPKPFINQAFMVMLVDKSYLISETDLSADTITENNLTDSITAQLADPNATQGGDSSESSVNKKTIKSKAPIYVLRINPGQAKVSSIDWGGDEAELVQKLFVDKNLKTIKKKIESNELKMKLAKKTIKEYEERLRLNPKDEVASTKKGNLESTIVSLQAEIDKANQRYDELSNYKISKDALGKQQTKFQLIKSNDVARYGQN